mgnify:CR=1 FL=1
MVFGFGSNKHTVVDIGSSAIKAAVISGNKSNIHISSVNCRRLPSGIINEGKIDDNSIVATELKELLEKMDIKPKKVITTIPTAHLLTRNFEMPHLKGNELTEAIKWELDDVLSNSVEETTFDYMITNKEEDSINVLVIAAQNEIIRQYKAPFKELGIKANVINIKPMALTSLLNYQEKLEEPAAIVDFGHQGTRIILCDKDHIFLTRTVDTGGYDFTKNIMDSQQYDYQEAEEHKWNNGIIKSPEDQPMDEDVSLLGVGDDLEGIAKEIIDEISRSIEFYSIKNRGENIENLYITGGSSLLDGLDELIEEETGLKGERIDPFLNVTIDSMIEKNNKEFYSIVVGLGISEVMHNES